MFIDIKDYLRYKKITAITLWTMFGLIVAASILNSQLDSNLLVLAVRFFFAVFILTGCVRATLFALSPVPGQIPAVLRLVYGFALAFILLVVGIWMMFNFVTGLLA